MGMEAARRPQPSKPGKEPMRFQEGTMRSIFGGLGLLLLSACGRDDQARGNAGAPPAPTPSAPEMLILKVDGMMKAEGGKT